MGTQTSALDQLDDLIKKAVRCSPPTLLARVFSQSPAFGGYDSQCRREDDGHSFTVSDEAEGLPS
jgi:hypothetical protein